MGAETKAMLEFLGSGISEPIGSSRSQKNLKQSRLMSLSGLEWLAHQLVREIVNISVEIGEDIIVAKDMPEWEKAVELEDIICWQALMDFDTEDKIVAKRREKSKKHKNKNKNSKNLLSHDPVPKITEKKRNKKMKINVLEPGQKTLVGFGFVKEKKTVDLSVVKYRHGETQLMLENSEPLRIELKPGTAGSRVRREVKEVKSSKEIMKVSRGGEDVEYKSSLLKQKRGTECQNLEGGKYTHFAGPLSPAAQRVGIGVLTPKRKFSKVFNQESRQSLKPINFYCNNGDLVRESPAKKFRF